jgi:hypothetical protein
MRLESPGAQEPDMRRADMLALHNLAGAGKGHLREAPARVRGVASGEGGGMSSAAEERIRLKAEAALRYAFPDARIIHELVMTQGGCRIDLAAVTPTRLVAVEVKSERDTLDRLARQLEQARAVADAVLVVTVERHIEAVRRSDLAGYLGACLEDEVSTALSSWISREVHEAATNAPARLSMLWAGELRAVATEGPRSPRQYCIRKASDGLPGAEVRRRVCAALRARVMPRADPPILSELFQRPTEGVF